MEDVESLVVHSCTDPLRRFGAQGAYAVIQQVDVDRVPVRGLPLAEPQVDGTLTAFGQRLNRYEKRAVNYRAMTIIAALMRWLPA